jgi:hypothetical protein
VSLKEAKRARAAAASRSQSLGSPIRPDYGKRMRRMRWISSSSSGGRARKGHPNSIAYPSALSIIIIIIIAKPSAHRAHRLDGLHQRAQRVGVVEALVLGARVDVAGETISALIYVESRIGRGRGHDDGLRQRQPLKAAVPGGCGCG